MAIVMDAGFTTELKEKVDAVLQRSQASGERVAAWDQIVQLLTRAKLCWRSQVAPEFVGVHPENRSHLGGWAAPRPTTMARRF